MKGIRKIGLAAATAAGAALVMAAGNAPANFPGNDQTSYAQNNGNEAAYMYVSGNIHSGVIYAGSSSGGTRMYFDQPTLLLHEAAPNGGYCVYYNASVGDLDILACNASKKSDQWTFGNRDYSEMISEYNLGICVWYDNNNTPVQPLACNASVAGDKWKWYAV